MKFELWHKQTWYTCVIDESDVLKVCVAKEPFYEDPENPQGPKSDSRLHLHISVSLGSKRRPTDAEMQEVVRQFTSPGISVEEYNIGVKDKSIRHLWEKQKPGQG